jgi:hypothetical protein
MTLRRWTLCSFHGKRKLSNEELKQTHEGFGLATLDPEKECYNKETMVSDWIETFYTETIIELKEASMRYKNISPSYVLFKNEMNNEHTAALLYINPSYTD